MTTESEPRTSAPGLVVGVGASAGGLDAAARLLGAMPTDSGMAIVIVMLIVQLLRGGRLVEAFLLSVSLAVAAVPEGLSGFAPGHGLDEVLLENQRRYELSSG